MRLTKQQKRHVIVMFIMGLGGGAGLIPFAIVKSPLIFVWAIVWFYMTKLVEKRSLVRCEDGKTTS